jgi:hypothetical protein
VQDGLITTQVPAAYYAGEPYAMQSGYHNAYASGSSQMPGQYDPYGGSQLEDAVQCSECARWFADGSKLK